MRDKELPGCKDCGHVSREELILLFLICPSSQEQAFPIHPLWNDLEGPPSDSEIRNINWVVRWKLGEEPSFKQPPAAWGRKGKWSRSSTLLPKPWPRKWHPPLPSLLPHSQAITWRISVQKVGCTHERKLRKCPVPTRVQTAQKISRVS
jgi:hypothetical protein